MSASEQVFSPIRLDISHSKISLRRRTQLIRLAQLDLSSRSHCLVLIHLRAVSSSPHTSLIAELFLSFFLGMRAVTTKRLLYKPKSLVSSVLRSTVSQVLDVAALE